MSKKKKNEIDPSLLPNFNTVICSLNILTNKINQQHIKDSIPTTERENYQILSREEIIKNAQELKLYIDESQMTDKQKKDKNFENIPRKLTPAIMANSFKIIMTELIQTKRFEKYEYEEAIKAGKDPKKKAKKETKKKPKNKGKKDEEEEIIPEKQFEEDYEFLYLIQDYPRSRAECVELAKTAMGVDVIFDVKVDFKEEVAFSQISGSKKSKKSMKLSSIREPEGDIIEEENEEQEMEVVEELELSLEEQQDIADRLGFEEANHFSSFFKHYTGITPTTFKSKKYNY